ncbi:DNA-binding transcriptional regulator, LysR family [Variovorax sp. OK605]|jgi:DNA-binding transcriptional LysR family regulator|uniref:LysR family transcriptional regulator n=1 Tax=unclassified Variovorax TaxID=663243 RepID=UPI0008D28C51|nr:MULTISPECIES: LysR family transcriptional regulator [unclassified Variovorax]SEK17029.1 transcriptional regulator, LysR family [Variovorax sp. OK202]SFE68762.1 transcriptional regulator, LysR family [Variovorax sp. OK212]SFQ23600.1 DNA-binding transcriptional regulator, LysR family [Variovorax sp. OK605]
MDIRSIDLNLLVIFEAMARHRSVNRTAEAVGLSQPATSAALARLRAVFDDPLFVRAGAQMEPTPRAQELAPAVQRVVQMIQSDILQPAGFEPAHTGRGFTILTPDIGEVAFLPGVLRRLRQEAPHVTLRALAKPRLAAAQALEAGEADLAVGFFPDLHKAGYFQQALFKTSYACIACARNSAAGPRMTLKQYLSARHVVVRPDGREHHIDRLIEAKGWQRHVTMELSHFMSLLALLPGSDLIATVPDDIATVVGRHVPLKKIELPFRPPQIQVQQYWHRRLHSDPANRWLRKVFYEVNRRDANAEMPL